MLTCIITCSMNISHNISMHYQHTKPKIIIIPLSFSHVRITTRTRKSINSRDNSKLIIPIPSFNHTKVRSVLLIITTPTIKGLISTKSRIFRRLARSAVAPRISMARADLVCITSWWRVSVGPKSVLMQTRTIIAAPFMSHLAPYRDRKKGFGVGSECKLVHWLFTQQFLTISISGQLTPSVHRTECEIWEFWCPTNDC